MGLCFALAVASVVYTALFLDFKTSQLELISPSNPLVGLSKRLKPFEGKDSFTVVIEAPTPHEAVRFLEKLVQRLEGDQTHYKDIFYRVDPQLMRPWALLYLEGKEIQDIEERIQDYPTLVRGILQRPDLENFLELVNREMTSRMVGALFTDILKLDGDMQQGEIRSRPMDLGFLIKVLEGMESYLSGSPSYRSPWTAFFKEGSWDRDLEGYFWAADKRFLLFFVTPRLEKATFLRGKASLEHLRGLINEVGSGFPDVRVGVTGQEALRTDEMSVALGDMSWATWISFAGVWALMVVFFRSEGRTFIRMISMVVGMCWTFGWATLFVGHLNILSMVFAPLLVGIGVDYGIHWFARMEEEERQPSRSVQDVILTVAKNSGPGILIAGISAGVSFIPFVLTGFQGLVELGLISGVGILIHLLADFTVLPTLSLLVGRPKRRRNQAQHSARRSNLLRWDRKRAGWVLAGAVGLSLASLILGTKVSFDLNPLNLQARGTESVEWALRLQEGSNRSVLYASSLAGSLEELQVKSAAFKALPTVWKTQSVLSLLPEEQDTKAQLLRSISQGLPPPDSSAQGVVPRGEVIRDLLERIRFKMDDSEADKWGASRPLVEQIASVRSLTGRILDALGSSEDAEKVLAEYQGPFRDDILDAFDLIRQAAQSRPMGVDDLPPALKDRFWRDGQFLIRIFPSENIWEPGPRDRFVAELRSVDPQVAGDAVTLHEFTDDFRSATVRAALYALAGNFLLLLLTFRRWTQPLMALVPVLAGVLWILGAMGLLGIDFNLANSIYLPLVVGAGTEYGIILLHRWREGGMDPGGLPRSTAKGVILAELTTTVGFGSLMICRHKGIFSLGALAFAGSFCVLGAAVLVLPAILAYVRMPGHDSGGRRLCGS